MPSSDPVKRRAHHAAWRARNREQHIDGVRWAKIKQKYGLTREDWNALLLEQDGGCAICPATIPGGRGQWHVDHDHETGKVRGLLCARCNRALGMFGDSATILEAALNYLRKHSSP